ncbi:unnamed protein product [Closterium sp. NIES-54]
MPLRDCRVVCGISCLWCHHYSSSPPCAVIHRASLSSLTLSSPSLPLDCRRSRCSMCMRISVDELSQKTGACGADGCGADGCGACEWLVDMPTSQLYHVPSHGTPSLPQFSSHPHPSLFPTPPSWDSLPSPPLLSLPPARPPPVLPPSPHPVLSPINHSEWRKPAVSSERTQGAAEEECMPSSLLLTSRSPIHLPTSFTHPPLFLPPMPSRMDDSAAGFERAQGAAVAGVSKSGSWWCGRSRRRVCGCPLPPSPLPFPPSPPRFHCLVSLSSPYLLSAPPLNPAPGPPPLPLIPPRVDEPAVGPKLVQGAAVAGVPKVAAGGARGAQEERAAAVPDAGRAAPHALVSFSSLPPSPPTPRL